MQISVEAVIAIVALFLALPPTIAILVKFYCRYGSNHVPSKESQDAELGLASRGSSPRSQNPPWRATSIQVHLLFEEAGRRRPFEELLTHISQSNMSLLENNRPTVPKDE
ncbi:hypothetical protein F5Y10DRAFT_120693 [Nemania abortiva]|nr:hypothetical protein F5Y10DRAFT_120693 [Nemania abortiva]